MPSLHFGTSVMAHTSCQTSAAATALLGAYTGALGLRSSTWGEHYVVDLLAGLHPRRFAWERGVCDDGA